MIRPIRGLVLPGLWLASLAATAGAQAVPKPAGGGTIETKSRGTEADPLELINKYHEQGRDSDAIAVANAFIETQERTERSAGRPLAPNPELARAYLAVGVIQRARKNSQAAEIAAHRALEIWERAGQPNERTVEFISLLATILIEQAKYSESDPLIRRAMTLAEKAHGPNSPEMGSLLAMQAQSLAHQARYVEAEPLMTRAVHILDKAPAERDPRQSFTFRGGLIFLSKIQLALGHYDQAEASARRALSVDERKTGSNKMPIGADLAQLSEILNRAGRAAEAEPLARRALGIAEESFGPESLETAESLRVLVFSLMLRKKFRDAERLQERLVAIRCADASRDDAGIEIRRIKILNLLDSLGVMTEVRMGLRKKVEAEQEARTTLQIAEKEVADGLIGAVELLPTLDQLTEICLSQKRYAEGSSFASRALAIKGRAFGSKSLDLLPTLRNLAYAENALGHYAEAEALTRRAIAIKETEPRSPEDLVAILEFLKVTLRNQRKYDEISTVSARIDSIRRR